MKKVLLALIILLTAGSSYGSPSFYFASRYDAGGLYTINTAASEVIRIDSVSQSHDFISLATFDSDKLLLTDFTRNTIYVYSQDGTVLSEYSVSPSPAGAIQGSAGNICYSSYYDSQIRKIDVTTQNDVFLYDADIERTRHIVKRSSDTIYVVGRAGTPPNTTFELISITGTVYNFTAFPSWLVADDNDNLFFSENTSTILKLDGDNNESVFFSDPDITIYNFAYNAADGYYYGIGADEWSAIHVYQFDKNGGISQYLSDISGAPSVLNNSYLTILDPVPAIPEPLTVILLLTSLAAVHRVRK